MSKAKITSAQARAEFEGALKERHEVAQVFERAKAYYAKSVAASQQTLEKYQKAVDDSRELLSNIFMRQKAFIDSDKREELEKIEVEVEAAEEQLQKAEAELATAE